MPLQAAIQWPTEHTEDTEITVPCDYSDAETILFVVILWPDFSADETHQ